MQHNVIEQQVLPTLAQVLDPLTGRDLLSLAAVSDIAFNGSNLSLQLTLAYPGEQARQGLVASVREALSALPDVDELSIAHRWQVPPSLTPEGKQPIPGVTQVIAVASGKGGVGKSTTTVNVALAMAQLGARVGILDADIYGPSQPHMLGVSNKRPEIRDQQAMIPVTAYGVQSISMGYLLTEKTPAVWRGPMATGALQQLLFQSDWDQVDYLFIDMPPGTGDIQLTLSQQVPVSGAVVVTTPQDIALLDAKKGIEMFAKVNIPVLGIVENMAVHQCSHCGHTEHIFGAGGGERIAADYHTELLGALPLALSIREDADKGKPSVIAAPQSDIAQRYSAIAQKIAAGLWLQQLQGSGGPEIVVTDD
ncbi:MAG: iron-sulfur cluster carrier protein ApbC [Cellvibrionaceae bacterium]|nr:iron-sulfur cluster carrier protein ApbC [Cellvibrionaceae bacterium]